MRALELVNISPNNYYKNSINVFSVHSLGITMTTLKLTYFDVDGGRAEPIRLALHLAGMTFEDYRFSYNDFPQERQQTPLGQVPTLAIDDVTITQSNAILRYVGKQAELYPRDSYQALICDEVMDAADDCINKITATFFLADELIKEAREKLVNTDLTKYLTFIESKLIAQGGEYFAEQRLSIADLKIMPIIGWLNSGMLEHVPTDLVASVAPALNKHAQRVLTSKGVAEYYANRQR